MRVLDQILVKNGVLTKDVKEIAHGSLITRLAKLVDAQHPYQAKRLPIYLIKSAGV